MSSCSHRVVCQNAQRRGMGGRVPGRQHLTPPVQRVRQAPAQGAALYEKRAQGQSKAMHDTHGLDAPASR